MYISYLKIQRKIILPIRFQFRSRYIYDSFELTRRSEALQWGSSWSRPASADAWQARIAEAMVDKAHRGGEPRLGARWAPILGTSCEDSLPSDLCCYRCSANPRTVVAVALCRCTVPRLAVLLGTSSETETRRLNYISSRVSFHFVHDHFYTRNLVFTSS